MAQQPSILSPREPLTGKDGNVTRSWWRFFDSLNGLSGRLTNPVVIAPNSIITPGDINSGSTVTLAESPAGTVLGNSQNVAAPPTPQVVDASLVFNGGTLAARSLPPGTLAGNASVVAAPPGPIIIGDNLTLSGNRLNAVAFSGPFPIYAPLVNGDLPGATLIGYPEGMIKGPTIMSDAVGQCIMGQIA